MTVRIVCDYCSGELQIPSESAAKKIRCPLCGKIFVGAKAAADTAKRTASASDGLRDAPPANAPARSASPYGAGPDASAPWSPISEEDLDSSLPWYVWVGAMAPAGMLAFVAPEPVAFIFAGLLVVAALIIASRRSWPPLSRFTGVVSLALLGFGAAAAVNLYSDGDFSHLGFRFLGFGHDDRPSIDLAEATWTELAPPDLNFGLLFPGVVAKGFVGEKSGLDILVYQSKFPKQGATFALHTFKMPSAAMTEATEILWWQRMDGIAHDVFEWRPDQSSKAFLGVHPGLDYQISVVPRTHIACRAYLVRDRAYVLIVSAENYDAIKPLADKFFASFRLVNPVEAMRAPVREPDWKSLGRPPIVKAKPLASLRGHFRPPISVLAFSADGKQLVSGSASEHLVLWDIASGRGATIAGNDWPFFAIEPTRKILAAPISPLATTGGEEMRFLPLEASVPQLGQANTDFVGFTPDGKTAIVALDSRITAWNIDEGVKIWHRSTATAVSPQNDAPVIAYMAVTRDGSLAATAGTQEGTIKLWDIAKKGVDLATWQAHARAEIAKADNGKIEKPQTPIQQLAFAPDNKKLASAGFDATVKIWDISDVNRPKLDVLLMQETPVTNVEYSNDGKLLATGDSIGVVRIWDTERAKLLHEFRACEALNPISMMRFSPDDSTLAAAVEMGVGRCGVNLFEIKSLPAAVGSLSFSIRPTGEPPLLNSK